MEPTTGGAKLTEVLSRDAQPLLEAWLGEQARAATLRPDLLSEAELRQQSREFLHLLGQAAGEVGMATAPGGTGWAPVREFLSALSRTRALQGFTPTETATFVLSLKQPLFVRLQAETDEAEALATEVWAATRLLDALALLTTEVFLQSRESVIRRQQQELLELSTPVVKLWDGVVAVPLIGTLDSARTQVVMENLLQKIVETGAQVAIIDITGVPTVDTLVAQHLIKTVQAARLMGADCVISGIRPQIAQTIVHLGVVLENVVTKATLADAIQVALRQLGIGLGSGVSGRMG